MTAIRFFDVGISFAVLILLSPIFILIAAIIYCETGSIFFIQERVGKNNTTFKIIKFRTMKLGTKSVPTHLIQEKDITKTGKFLRAAKLDELPQFWNVMKNEMCIVGPRPCLVDQFELINARRKYNLTNVKPGITGVSQLRGADMSTPVLLAKLDAKMCKKMGSLLYFKIIFGTAFKACKI
jgi:lipopolysaccharide/colanic/teichoic acid biosynthesis glycosyltransferase